MIGNDETGKVSDTRREWIEPEVSELNVAETANFPFRGRDGSPFADCTRS